MKSTWFSKRSRYEFGKLLEESSRGNGCWKTFGSFLALSTLSLRQANNRMLFNQIDDTIEAEYMREVKQVDKPEKLAMALSVLTDSLAEEPVDFLGQFMSEMAMNDKSYQGQCFTPKDVCRMMAKMCLHDIDKKPPNHRMLIQEPASGCGAMVIATTEELRSTGRGPHDYYFVTTDIDSRCVQSCFIQFTLLDIPATVIHGNTLTLEQWSSWNTLRAILTPFSRDVRKESQSSESSVKRETCEDPAQTNQSWHQPLLF